MILKEKNNKFRNIIVVVILVISFSMIGVGVYFNILAKPKNITGMAVDKLTYLFKNYIDSGKDSFLGDNFTLESDIDFNIKSEYYAVKFKTDQSALQMYKFLNNLSNLDSQVTIKQNAKEKKAFFEITGALAEEKLINAKYLVDNSTEYYFVEGILENYVNNGSNNYFESFNAEDNSIENIDYLYNFILESFKNNLKDEYFKKSVTETSVFEKKEQVNLISMKIDNKVYKEILTGILNDLKGDEKSNNILTSVFEDFSKMKIKDDKVYLKNSENYTINIYTSKVLNKLLKAEIVYLSGSSKESITYEGNESEGNIYLIDNDKIKSIISCKFEANKYEFKFKDSSDKKLGTLKIEFNSKSKSVSLSIDSDKTKIDLVYVSKYVGKKTKESYTNEKKLTFKIIENTISKYSGDIIVTTKVKNNAEIKEDVSNAVLKSTLTEEQKNVLENKMLTVMERLAR